MQNLETKLLFFSKTIENFGGKENGLSIIVLIGCYASFSTPKNITETCLTHSKKVPIFSARILNIFPDCQVLQSSVFTLCENMF